MDLFPDYHEHQEFQPAMLALSHFIIQWNWAEHSFGVLLWALSGDFITGAQYTIGLGNQSRADLVLAMARRKERDAEILNLIEFSVKAFGRIKDNRNALAHAHSVSLYPDEQKPRWLRASKNPKALHVFCYADEDDIISNLNSACQLSILLGPINAYYMSSLSPPPKPVAVEFELPKSLAPISVPLIDEQS